MFVAGCAVSGSVQPRVNSLTAAGRYDEAFRFLRSHRGGYGTGDRLLEALDRGMTALSAGRYSESREALAEAETLTEDLGTRSLSREGAALLTRQEIRPYRPSDPERILLRVLQILNHLVLDDIEGAVVEARGLDGALSLLDRRWYRDDPFARLVMGIAFEAAAVRSGDFADLNDAFIAYRRAWRLYAGKGGPPRILAAHAAAVGPYVDPETYADMSPSPPQVSSWPRARRAAEVCVFQLHGLAPLKGEETLPVPLPGGHLTRISVPVARPRPDGDGERTLKARDAGGRIWTAVSEPVEDVGGLVTRAWEAQKAFLVAETAASAGGKYVVERAIEGHVGRREGRDVVRLLGSLYNLATQGVDLRSWQTLPEEVRIACLVLPPGDYRLRFADHSLGEMSLEEGARRFFVVRTAR